MSISIPFVKGDLNGKLTEAIIHQITLSGDYRYVADGGDYVLEVDMISDRNEQIGYQYDRHPTSQKLFNRLRPSEGRKEITVGLRLLNTQTNELTLPYTIISASEAFDFVDSDSIHDVAFINKKGVRESVLNFSLGQLDSKEGASDAASTPLYNKIGRKIANGLRFNHLINR
ncbi:MAG: hypothetical protein KAR79_01145 [Simkaniaceae bacterium]|nr:hypothetical protein [Simkaniaceae bacterium]